MNRTISDWVAHRAATVAFSWNGATLTNLGRTIFAQLLDFVLFKHFEYLVEKFSANHAVRSFSVWSHFLCLAYAQLTRRTDLRDLMACLNSQRTRLYHVGIRSRVSRATLADANERRDGRLFVRDARPAADHHGHGTVSRRIGLGLREPLYAMDSTVIDLCLMLFLRADFRALRPP